jgi:hypothetical protein
VTSPGSLLVQIRKPGPPVELSNAASLLVVASAANDESISLTAGAPVAAGKDVAVVDIVPAAGSPNNLNLLGVVTGNSCLASGGPVSITRPAAGVMQVDLCIGGADPMQTFTLSGPVVPDILITNVQPLPLGPIQTRLTLTMPSTAQPGLRTLFAVDQNGNKTAASGAILVK